MALGLIHQGLLRKWRLSEVAYLPPVAKTVDAESKTLMHPEGQKGGK